MIPLALTTAVAAALLPAFEQAAARAAAQAARPHAASTFGSAVVVSACLRAPGADTSAAVWTWLSERWQGGSEAPAVLVAPRLTRREVAALAEAPDASGVGERLGLRISALPGTSPLPGIVCTAGGGIACAEQWDAEPSGAALERPRAWVDRVLAPGRLHLCPFTASSSLSAIKLEAQGISPAPITHGFSRAAHLAPLLADFWDVARRFVAGGPAASSSIVLSAPAWDNRFDEWRDDVFPLLEESLLACGLGRTLGIVCFHPSYTTPPPAFLARRRFGHMHGLPTLRGWLERHEPELSAETDDGDLHWAGSVRMCAHAQVYIAAPKLRIITLTRGARAQVQRRSPHAMINVLWADQLAAAEGKRASSSLYARNIARCLRVGRDRMEADAEEERARAASAWSQTT